MQIVNPSFGQMTGGGEQIACAPVDWAKDPVVLFSNSKPNARELLEGVRDRMGEFRNIDNIDYVYKDSASQPAPTALIDEVANKYRVALLAIAD